RHHAVDRIGSFAPLEVRGSAPCLALAGIGGAGMLPFPLSRVYLPARPSLDVGLLSTSLAAPRRCGTMRALTPAALSQARQVSLLTPLCLPDVPPPTT